MSKPFLGKVTFEFGQEGNTDGTTGTPETDGWEVLTVEVQSSLKSLTEAPGYLVLRTPTGWSISDPSELADLLNQVTNSLKY